MEGSYVDNVFLRRQLMQKTFKILHKVSQLSTPYENVISCFFVFCWQERAFNFFTLFIMLLYITRYIYIYIYVFLNLFIWLHWVLVVAHGIFSCGMQDLLLWHVESLVVACGIQFPDKGSNPGPLNWECGVLATGPPGKPQYFKSIYI